jgi:paraquat-inducible protein B
MSFDGDTGELKVGAPVQLKGFMVGEVTSVELTVGSDGQIRTRVGVALDPLRFHIDAGSSPAGDWTRVMNTTLDTLVARGLRARLTQSPPVVGSSQVAPVQIPQAPPATLVTTAGRTQIPTVQAGGVEQLVSEIGNIPLQQIADNVRVITQQVRALTGSPQLRESVGHLNASLSQLDQTLRQRLHRRVAWSPLCCM